MSKTEQKQTLEVIKLCKKHCFSFLTQKCTENKMKFIPVGQTITINISKKYRLSLTCLTCVTVQTIPMWRAKKTWKICVFLASVFIFIRKIWKKRKIFFLWYNHLMIWIRKGRKFVREIKRNDVLKKVTKKVIKNYCVVFRSLICINMCLLL